MSLTVEFDGINDINVVIPPDANRFPHDDGTVEAYLDLSSASVDRPEALDGRVIATLEGGSGTIDLVLTADAAERLGVALIQAATMPIRRRDKASRN